MSSNNKPSIPAWQRAPPPAPSPPEDPVYAQAESNDIETGERERREDISAEKEKEGGKEIRDASPNEEAESVPADTTSPTTAPHPDAVPSPPPSTSNPTAFTSSDFAQYQQQTAPRPSQPQQPQQRPTAPPIITYPEFLVDAHKPPPLITPSRVINTIYFAGGISALLYGANKWLHTPMIESLSTSRHDLYTHSHSKLEEFNSRLSKIVSKLPAEPKHPDEQDDIESISSDPTELYHRDMGTQTSDLPPIKKSTNTPSSSPLDHHTNVLRILHSHLEEMAESSDKVGDAHTERLLTCNKFRHYLDGMVYNTDGLPTWEAGADGAMSMKQGSVKQDGIEDLKKEIRGVKGVLLSARRFPTPGVGAGVGRGGTS